MSGFLSALLAPFLGRVPAFESVGPSWNVQHPTTSVPAEVEPPSDAAGPLSPAVSCASLGRDRNEEPEHLRKARERLQRAEVERDLALAAFLDAEQRYAKMRPTWSEG